jgi:hypothetical protein
MGEEVREDLGALGHAEVLRGWPLADLGAGEFEPSFDALEHLDLERCEEHGQVCAFREGVPAVEVRRHEFDDCIVVFTNVGFEFVEGTEEIIDGSMIGKQESEQSFGFEAGGAVSWCLSKCRARRDLRQ